MKTQFFSLPAYSTLISIPSLVADARLSLSTRKGNDTFMCCNITSTKGNAHSTLGSRSQKYILAKIHSHRFSRSFQTVHGRFHKQKKYFPDPYLPRGCLGCRSNRTSRTRNHCKDYKVKGHRNVDVCF
jgi:hypothetical protein